MQALSQALGTDGNTLGRQRESTSRLRGSLLAHRVLPENHAYEKVSGKERNDQEIEGSR